MRVVLWLTTSLRFALIPVFLRVASGAQATALAGGDPSIRRWLALAILLAMGVTDILDGQIARRYDLATQLGAIVDAVADKLVQVVLVAFFTFVDGPVFTSLPVWFLVVVFGRDLVGLVGWLALRARYGPFEIIHRGHGRVVTFSVFLVLAGAAMGIARAWLYPLLILAALLSALSVTAYGFEGLARARAAAEGRGASPRAATP